MKKQNYYLGLDIGTNSVGYAVTDKEYNLLKFRGEPAWGSIIFDEGSLKAERRGFRSARRRLDRKKQRVALLKEIFAPEISKVDEKFFVRLDAGRLYREDFGEPYTLFNDKDFNDKDYHKKYPTIHHLICDLMTSKEPHDVRLVYLAISWLVSHRGHFLSNIDKNNLSSIKEFDSVYNEFMSFFTEGNSYAAPWDTIDSNELSAILKDNIGIKAKNKKLIQLLYNGKKPSKKAMEDFPFNREAIVNLLAGGKCKISDLFNNDEYVELGSVLLSMDDDKMAEIMSGIGGDFELISVMRGIYDWATLVNTLGDSQTISEAKVKVYEQHKQDLKTLKYFIKKYSTKEVYNDVFNVIGKDNYVAYSYHTDSYEPKLKKKNKEDFSKYILGIISKITPDSADEELYTDMKCRLEIRTFMPKQKDTDNRVVPHQLYWYELNEILNKASSYLSFLDEKDSDGYETKQKIIDIFLFKIPYFVGPLNRHSSYAWLERKADGEILPWNFNEKVDLDASEEAFIKRMTNTCSYLPGEPVLPKDSLIYHKFMVLNEINNIRINGVKISVELKQNIYNDLFMYYKKVSKKKLINYLVLNGKVEKGEEDSISGIDDDIKSNLAPQISFKRLFENKILSEDDAERIVNRSSYAEDKSRLNKWLLKEYPNISEEDRKYICGLKFSGFGRLSEKLLNGIEGSGKEFGGEVHTILSALWNTNCNLMELLSGDYTFKDAVRDFNEEYYSQNKATLEKRLDDMYISNAVRRPIYRTLDIVKDVVKGFGEPEKIFIEMTRGGKPEQKGKRTKSRKEQIIELYKNVDEDVKMLTKQLEEMGDLADNKLQSDKLFLYYMQLGRCMYSGKVIDLENLSSKMYDIDHIYPQSLVKDDSIINNKVLCLSEENGTKSDFYPIKPEIRKSMYGFWKGLKDKGLISDEKFKRLTRGSAFSDEEKFGFVNRQLTETSQTTKAVANLLKDKYENTEIVYSKAGLVSDYRHEFDLLKSRTFNDLHHAKDAYLNIVTGNVYSMKFTKKWFNVNNYNIKTKTLFTHEQMCGNECVWEGERSIAKVRDIVVKNNAHFVKSSFFKRGGLFDQMPVSASSGLTPLKKGLPTEKYGGYNKAGAMFFIPVKYTVKKKTEILIMSVELLYGEKYLSDLDFAKEYSFNRLKHILGKDVDTVEFPMGMRPWKINTVLSLDGFRACISGMASGGKSLIMQPLVQFSESHFWENYIKKIESFVEKNKNNSKYIYDEKFDYVKSDLNVELYDIYVDKLKDSIYSKRVNNPISTLSEGKEKFEKLDIVLQSNVLLIIHSIFGRLAGGCDLSLIGGVSRAASTQGFSASISNWAKSYKDVRIIDQSPSGMWEKKSDNLLDLL